MILANVFSPGLIKCSLESEDKEEVFEELVELYVSSCPSASRASILSALKSRESKLSTGIKSGIAIPHAQTGEITGVRGVVGVSRKGIDYDALDGKPVHIIFLLLSSREGCAQHLRALRRLAFLLEDPGFFQAILAQKDPEAIYATICKYEDMLALSLNG